MERPISFIENNFLAGRTFSTWEDLNRQARQWCDRVNSTYKKHLRAVPRELFALEQTCLKPLPAWIPEVYRIHERIVDIEGYVALHSNRYSVPYTWTGRRVEIRETRGKSRSNSMPETWWSMIVWRKPNSNGSLWLHIVRHAVKASGAEAGLELLAASRATAVAVCRPSASA